MTYLNQLSPTTTKAKKRLGRGYGSGKGGHTTNRGQKGQKARRSIHPAFMGTKNKKSLIQRLPLMRGKGKFKSLQDRAVLVSLTQLNSLPENTSVTRDFLVANRIIKTKSPSQPIKVVANGELSVKLQVALPVTAKARELIIAAGGQILAYA